MIKPYYEEKDIKIYHGDCLEIMPQLEPVDLVLTDPPYGVTKNNWDKIERTKAAFDLLFPCALISTCQNPATAELIVRYFKYFKWSDIWQKTQAVGFLNAQVMPLRQHEDILVFSDSKIKYNPQIQKKPLKDIRPYEDCSPVNRVYGKFNTKRKRSIGIAESYPRSVITIANSQNSYHPNEKPKKLMSYLLKTFSDQGNTILDPFMGSGTTLVAAKELGRKAIGIEIEEKYCEIAVDRLRQGVFDWGP